MLVRVEGPEFIKVLDTLCSNKQIVNFTVNNKMLHVEVFEPIIVSIPINIVDLSKQYENDTYYTISVEINSSYNLIPENCTVSLDIGKDILTIKAPGYECRFKSAYEDRFEIPTEFSSSFEMLDSGRNLENVVRISQYATTFSKYMQIEEPGVIVVDRTAYILSGPIAIKTTLNFPDSIWLRQVLRAMNAVFNVNHIDKPTLNINNKSGVYGVINFGKWRDMAFSMRFTRNTQIDAINSVIKQLNKICSICVGDLSDKIKIIEKVYKKAEVTMAVGEGTYFITIRVGTENELVFGTRNTSNKIYVIDASIPMLSLINNIFRTASTVEVYAYNRYVMFKDETNLLLTTGLTQI